MTIHLNKIVENLRHYSKKLDNNAILTDQPWITKTENGNERFVIIFRKNNDLLISINGKVERGKWDYIPSMNSLLIERDSGTTLYNQGYFDDSIMILKVDGTNDYQLFANENKIESTIEKLVQEIENKYLTRKPPENKFNSSVCKNVVVKKLEDGSTFEIHSSLSAGFTVGDKVTINGKYPQDGKYRFGWSDTLTVMDGKIKRL